ncbi:MAG: hypothetical protein PHH54_01215 [Candidatus Nanoarchaeia archaeon]|nr:hypothetical protein [Candidatus Nanoarchaeia archaeon]MDD5740582.1 hypothetical protein [Candidatus Nanoarchaeia archaeon]
MSLLKQIGILTLGWAAEQSIFVAQQNYSQMKYYKRESTSQQISVKYEKAQENFQKSLLVPIYITAGAFCYVIDKKKE